MAFWSFGCAEIRETAFARWRSEVRGVESGFVHGDEAWRFASWTGSLARRTTGISIAALTLRLRHSERRGGPPSVSRGDSEGADGPYYKVSTPPAWSRWI